MQSGKSFEDSQRRQGTVKSIRHYRHLLWRAKWYLLVAGTTFTGLSLAVVAVLVSGTHEESTTAIIGVENTADLTAVKDVSGLMQAQSNLILSRSFLRDIAVKLSLPCSPNGFPRFAIFDSVYVDSLAAIGTYRFTIDPSNNGDCSVLFTQDALDRFSLISSLIPQRGNQVYKGKVAELTALTADGMRLVFSRGFRAAPHDFRFRIRPLQNTVEDLFTSMTVKESDSRGGVSNIAVSVKGRDFRLIADVANAIADAFVQKNASFKGTRTRSVVASLEKQLDAVSKDLEASTGALRNFRTANPAVGLSDNVKQRISGLGQMEKGALDAKKSLTDASELEQKYASASADDKLLAAQEIVVFLASRNVTATSAYQAELSDLSTQEREFRKNYAEDHPLRVENQRKLEGLMGDILAALKHYISSTQNGVAGQSTDIQSRYSELQSLPSKELELAELERRHQIFSDIYSTVMSRYNQAKVLNIGEVAEVFVMDPAVPPIPPPVNVPKLLGLVLLLSVVITFVPVLAADYFDRTAHSEDEFSRKTGSLVLEGVPKIDVLQKRNGNGWHGAGTASLITIQNEEGVSKEVFRALRTKIMLTLVNTPEKSVVVTSLEPGAGKSTIAANLAYALAQQQTKTVVIDADLRRGTLYKWFGKSQGPGLSDFIASSDPVTPSSIDALLQATTLPNLFLVSAGTPVQSSSELLASERFAQIKAEIAKRFQLMIVDSPPIEAVSDAAVFAHMFSGFLVVARAGRTDVGELTRKIGEYPIIEEKVLGFVLNGVSSERSAKYYRYSSYYAAAKPDKS